MTTNRAIFIVGALIFLIPFMGFPRVWEEGFLIFAGVALMLFASLNLWHRSVLKRLKFHSKKLVDTNDTSDEQEATTEENNNFA